MCQRIQCRNCSKPTYSGCGRHVEQVLGDVPASARCQCRTKRAAETKPVDETQSQSWLDRLRKR